MLDRLLRRSGLRRPEVSLLVDVRDGTAAGLDRSLHAARALRGPDLEILPFGPVPDSVGPVLARHAGEDWRVRRAGTPRGTFVLCLVAGDEPTPDTIAVLLAQIDGAEAAVGGVESSRQGRSAGATLPLRGAARPPGVGLLPAVLGRVLWRREVWDRLPHDDPSTTYLTGLLGGGDVRSVPETVVRRGEQPTAVFGAMPDPTPELAAWLEADTRAEQLLAAPATDIGMGNVTYGSPNHYQYRRGEGVGRRDWAAATALDAERFLDATERFDRKQWEALQQRLRRVVEDAGDALVQVPVEARVKAWLTAHDRRQALEAFVRDRRFEDGQFPTTVVDGSVHAAFRGLPLDVPDWCLELTEAETPLRASLVGVRQDGDALELRFFALIDRLGLDDFPETGVRLVRGAVALDLDVRPEVDPAATRFGGGRYQDQDRASVRARLPLVALAEAGSDEGWQLEVTCEVEGVRRTGLVAHHDIGAAIDQFEAAVAGSLVRVAAGKGRPVRIRVKPTSGADRARSEGPVLAAAAVDEDGLHLQTAGASDLGNLDRPVVRLVHPRVTLASTGSTAEGRFSIPLQVDEWGLGERPAPAGRYRLEIAGTEKLTLAEELRAQLPVTWQGGSHRVQLRTTRNGRLEVVLGPPLNDDELGPYRQQLLQRWYAETAPRRLPVERNRVYFQSYDGRSATDSPLAIFEELRRRPGVEGLDLVWAVTDEHAWTPGGARRVLWRSQEWYAALATSARIVTNIELERWFKARPGQRVLQSFHGYPSKTMGIGLWRAKNFTDSRIEQQLDRTSRNWDLLLTPAPEMDRHYREQYRYDGEILAAGYPRDDALLAPGADAVRSATRERLGIAEDQTVVLYAPTWRDDLAVNFRSARMGDHLELPALAEALGPGYAVLVRGHRFHARGESARAGRSSRLVDVTDYPEINDLILAADVAVLDYSSMRFDFALTGKPMVFLVPDLEDYTGGVRGFLYDFRETAPGPLAKDQAEVVAALRDLDGVRVRHEAAYKAFNETYNYRNDGHAAARVVDVFFRGLLSTP